MLVDRGAVEIPNENIGTITTAVIVNFSVGKDLFLPC